MTRVCVALSLLLAGCIDTSVEATTIDLHVGGSDATAPFEGRDGVMVTLERADVAFGPLTLCAGVTAGALCDEALAEWRDAAVVDALDPTPVEVGTMDAITGTTRSYMFDYGIVSRLTSDAPLVLPAAESLGDRSVVIEGRVDVDGQRVPFTIAMSVAQGPETEQGVPVVRSNESDGFDHVIAPDGGSRLDVHLDPRAWLVTADYRSLVQDDMCAAGADLVCAGSVEQTCAEDGALIADRDCAAMGQVCLRGVGCAERAEIGPESQIGRSVRNGLTAGARPMFDFD